MITIGKGNYGKLDYFLKSMAFTLNHKINILMQHFIIYM